MDIDSNLLSELQAWQLVDPLTLEQAVTLAVGVVPNSGRPRPAIFSPLLQAAETAVERKEIKPTNTWRSRDHAEYYGTDYIEPTVTQALFREWLEKTLTPELRTRAFFFLLPQDQWPAPGDTPEAGGDKPLRERERATLLCIIGALADLAKVDLSQHHKAGGQVEAMLSVKGIELSARTIGDHLRAAREAIERRRA